MQLADSGTHRRRAISLTPLIDVVFILLLFFMLSTQFSQQQAIQLSVPAQSATETEIDTPALRLRLSSDGNIALKENETVLPAALTNHEAVLAAIKQQDLIQLDADDDVPLQFLVRVTDLLEQAGARTVQLTALR